MGDDHVSIKAYQPGISDGMEEWVTKALQKKQSERFCSAAEMEEALQRALVGSNLARYNIFISYRVKSEHELAQSMFSTISDADASDQERLAVFLDKIRLVDGQRWDVSFIRALGSSDVFLPLVSIGALEPMARLTDQSTPDNLLLEWMLALWMFENGHIKSILPLLIGKPSSGNAERETLFDGLAQMARGGSLSLSLSLSLSVSIPLNHAQLNTSRGEQMGTSFLESCTSRPAPRQWTRCSSLG